MSSVTLGLARQVHHCSYGPAWNNVNDNLPEDACHDKIPEVLACISHHVARRSG
ncbi:MAG: hypothetical protein OXL36_11915 [Bryobacterales bacterium]|nr:hypothetical protein [Bryobacterales bacterium]